MNDYEILEFPLHSFLPSTNEIIQRIEERKKDWNKKRNIGKNGILYQSMVASAELILAGLKKNETAERARLDNLRKEALNRRTAELKTQILLLAGKGYLTEEEVDQLLKTFSNQLSAKIIHNIIADQKIEIRKKQSQATKQEPTAPEVPPGITIPQPVILDSLYTNLVVLLKLNGKSGEPVTLMSVYGVLDSGCTPTTSTAQLKKLAESYATKARSMKKNDSADPTVAVRANATAALAPSLVKFFESESTRKGFEYAWNKKLAQIHFEPQFNTVVTGEPPSIDYKTYHALIEQVQTFGLSEKEAEWLVYFECCKRRKAAMPQPPQNYQPPPPKSFCPHCYAANNPDAETCSSCGRPIFVTCPKCRKKARCNDVACSSCGFALGDIPLILERIKECRRAIELNNPSEATDKVKIVELYWANHPDLPALKAAIDTLWAKVLSRELLLVSAPTQGKVITKSNIARITWSAASINGKPLSGAITIGGNQTIPVKYRLVRKENSIPTGPEDGVILVESPVYEFEDTSLEPGIIYGYGVFTVLDKKASNKVANCGKCQIIPTPRNIQTTASNQALTISWAAVKGATGHILVRKTGSIPTSLKDGEMIHVEAGSNSYHDAGLSNGCTYGYLLVHELMNPDGQKVYSPAISCKASPVEPPEFLTASDWSVTRETSKEIVVKWNKELTNTISWYLSSAPLASPGTLLSVSAQELAKGKAFIQLDTSTKTARTPALFEDVAYVTPVIKTATHILICQYKTICNIEGVSRLQAIRSNGNIILTWDWPSACTEVRIVYSTTQYPTSPTDACKTGTVSCTKSSYDIDSFFVIRGMGDTPLYISVFARINKGREGFYSAPANIFSIGAGARTTITYKLSKTGGFLGFGATTRKLRVECSKGTALPALELRGKLHAPPININDGYTIMHLPGGSLCVEKVLPDVEKGTCVQLFVADRSLAPMYTINHPSLKDSTIS